LLSCGLLLVPPARETRSGEGLVTATREQYRRLGFEEETERGKEKKGIGARE
jgi:hypothetical protein